MELLNLVQTDTFEKIKEFITLNGVSTNSNKWFDYSSLNAALEYKRADVAKFMLEKNFRVNRTGKSATQVNTPLHHAAKMEDLELVKSLLERKASILAINEDGDTPLHLAFMNRNDPAVDAILSTFKNTKIMNPRNKRGLSHFHIACIRNNKSVVSYFLKSGVNVNDNIDVSSSLWSGYTALHFAVEFNSFEVAKLLLDAGADKSFKNTNGIMPYNMSEHSFAEMTVLNYFMTNQQANNQMSNFHVSCMRSNPNLIESFLSSGATVNNTLSPSSVFCPSYSPLHFAVESNNIENVKLLVNHGSDLNIKNGYYMTPLHLALYNDDHKKKDCTIVDFLYSVIRDKAVDCTDLNGLNYFHIACTRNDIDIVKKFLDHGEDVNNQVLYNLKNFSHYTPLHFAVRYNCLKTAELLIEKGANVNRSDNGMHGTPLHLAFDNGCEKMIELLLKNGADAKAIRPYDDKTMLHILVEQVMDRVWRLDDPVKVTDALDKIDNHVGSYIPKLVKSGCNINFQDADGNTALHIACSSLKNGFTSAKILLENGADINIENNEGDTPFNCTYHDVYRKNADKYMMFYEYVQKLKDLGLSVNPKNEECCKKLLREKDECDSDASCFLEKNISYKQKQRLEEIDRMKKVNVEKNISLFKFLTEDVKEISYVCKNHGIKKIMELKNFYKLYPSYGSLLQLQYQKGLDNLATVFFEKLMSIEVVEEPRAKRRRR